VVSLSNHEPACPSTSSARKGLPQFTKPVNWQEDRRGLVREIYPLKRIIHTPKKAGYKGGLEERRKLPQGVYGTSWFA